MKIPIDLHIKYMQTTYTNDELIKILKFFEKNVMPDADIKDQDVWYNLVSLFVRLPDDKKTKAFVYQTMAVNGIVDDSLNSKRYNKLYCEQIGGCWTVKNMLSKLNRKWQEDDFNNICCNLSICFLLPTTEFIFTNYPESVKEFELDDRILKTKR